MKILCRIIGWLEFPIALLIAALTLLVTDAYLQSPFLIILTPMFIGVMAIIALDTLKTYLEKKEREYE